MPRTKRPGVEAGVVQTIDELVPSILNRQRRALGRGLSLLEGGGDGQRLLVSRLYSRTGQAKVVGVTGPPGAGKSTLVDRLAQLYRSREETVGILAVDPSSSFSGGALLGDRVRMQDLATDPGVFIRSMATRGAVGGLARATRDAVDLLDAAGFDHVLVETVGVGQDEIDVVRTVDTVVVVTVPGLGDEIQAIKAGIMEIADVFVVNKADRDGVEHTVKNLEFTLATAAGLVWRPPILRTVASRSEGREELVEAIGNHRRWLLESGEIHRRRFTHLRLRVETILKQRILSTADQVLGLETQVERAFEQREDPYSLADRLFDEVLSTGQR